MTRKEQREELVRYCNQEKAVANGHLQRLDFFNNVIDVINDINAFEADKAAWDAGDAAREKKLAEQRAEEGRLEQSLRKIRAALQPEKEKQRDLDNREKTVAAREASVLAREEKVAAREEHVREFSLKLGSFTGLDS
ncbi:MAG TPA: hypothetical protein VGK77_23890 [Candidatus Binatia bacterium]|jgi:hypothetical protein